MGTHSTLYITRSKAKAVMEEKQRITDDELEAFMDRELDHRLYNCVIVDDDCENNDDGVV
jgi:hypothetical protein